MSFSIRLLLFVIAYIAISVACVCSPDRPFVALLETTTVLATLLAVVIALATQCPRQKNFWVGYAVMSFGWLYLHHGVPNREYYSAPATAAEWLANSEEIYTDLSEYDDPQYDGITGPTNKWRWRTAMRRRIRFMANMIASFVFGLIGGFVAHELSTVKDSTR